MSNRVRQFCSTKQKALKDMEAFKVESAKVLKEFAIYYTGATITVVPVLTSYIAGWGVEADLLCNGELVRHYPIADLALLDLNELMLKRILEQQKAAEKTLTQV